MAETQQHQMIHRKRLSFALASSLGVEVINKIIPLFVLHLAQKRLGLESFGFAQFGISVFEVMIPLLTYGYNNFGSIAIGKHRDDPALINKLVSNILTLKLLHALVIGLVAILGTRLIPSYQPYHTMMFALSFLLLLNVPEMMWVLLGIQKMVSINLFMAIARVISFGLIFTFVHQKEDAILFVILNLAFNVVFGLFTFGYALKFIRLIRPDMPTLRRILHQSSHWAVVVIAVILTERTDMLWAERLFGLTGSGLYAGAARLSHSLLQLVSIITLVFSSEMVIVHDKEGFTSHVRLAAWSLFFFLLPIMVGLPFVSGDILTLIYDQGFQSTHLVLNLLVVGTFFSALTTLFGSQVLMMRHQELTVIKGFVGGLGLAIGCEYGLAHIWGLPGIALGQCIGKGAAAAYLMVKARPHLTSLPWMELVKTAIPAVLMGLTLLILPAQNFIPRIAVGASSYLIFSMFFNRERLASVARRLTNR